MTSAFLILTGGAFVLLGIKYGARAFPQAARRAAEAVEKEAIADASYGKKFYYGGFEPQMSRREAALILGCRESATKERIMERYRVLMRLNHPDLGGSPYVSTKINEAKDFLAKRARWADKTKNQQEEKQQSQERKQ
eukprot:TRINITY_DN9167_c0_g1_i1.p1 TRINITY_DN9167_c0_g1~~TRINITY_DN9167_c0_g1_i1.p1  ORF type:complete len:149 (-),score=24.66 TRINITY_DN9167_c0_g1_i1:105-515(-)